MSCPARDRHGPRGSLPIHSINLTLEPMAMVLGLCGDTADRIVMDQDPPPEHAASKQDGRRGMADVGMAFQAVGFIGRQDAGATRGPRVSIMAGPRRGDLILRDWTGTRKCSLEIGYKDVGQAALREPSPPEPCHCASPTVDESRPAGVPTPAG